MEVFVIIATVLSLIVNGLLAYFVIANNRKHAKKYNELRTGLDDALKVAVDSINGEGAAQTEIIKQKSGEEQAMLEHLQEEVSHKIDGLLTELRATARSIHLDVHDNLKNIVFDNFASREDKVKSRVLDSLGYAIKYAAHDEKYMRELVGLLDKGDTKVKEINAATRDIQTAEKKEGSPVPPSINVPPPPQSSEKALLEEALKAYDNAVPAQELTLPPLRFNDDTDLESQLAMLADLRKQTNN